MAQPLTNDIHERSTACLLREINAAFEEIAARGDFADAPSRVTDGLDAAQRYADQALEWLDHDAPIMSRDQWAPSFSMAKLGLVRRAR